MVLPAWLLVGLSIGLFPSQNPDETEYGDGESALHMRMVGSGPGAILASMFWKINALVFAIIAVALIAHETDER